MKEFQAFTTGNFNAPVRLAAIDPDGAGTRQLYVSQGFTAPTHQLSLFEPLAGDLVDKFLEVAVDFRTGFNLG